mmetsp:Transcript_61001/g.133498  ORF Transcript_61001/g.133498 Transcript_61001/m.133498 type:complete len:128 (+) Transcript_61001:176-559(+)
MQKESFRDRRSQAFNEWYTNAWRSGGEEEDSEGDAATDIYTSLFSAQVQTAVLLEERVRVASCGGGLALCLVGLQRTRLKAALEKWSQVPRQGPPPSAPPQRRLSGQRSGSGLPIPTGRTTNVTTRL